MKRKVSRIFIQQESVPIKNINNLYKTNVKYDFSVPFRCNELCKQLECFYQLQTILKFFFLK